MFRGLLACAMLFVTQAGAMDFTVSSIKGGSGRTLNLVRMKGMVDPRDWTRFMMAASALAPGNDTLFTIDSPGGNVQLGLFLINKIEDFLSAQKQAGRKVAIAVEHDCSSMCVPIYYTFETRFALTGSRIGLHAVSLGGLQYDPQMTQFYLDNLLKHADQRADQKSLDFFHAAIKKGDFYSTELDPYRAEDLANADSGLIGKDGLFASEAQLILAL